MTINLSMPEIRELKPRITVIGVGGAGGNAVNNMIRAKLEGVEFVVANTDAQALSQSLSERRLQLGVNITHGLGAGSRPDVGRAAAEEEIDQIVEALQGSHMAFITAGMGGGTGTGAAPVVAQAARDQGILTVGVVTKPFQFEGPNRMAIADNGVEELHSYVDTLIIIPNQNLFRVANEKTTFADAFKMADDVLHAGVRGVTDLMIMPGLINLDFADVRAVMSEMGKAMMGTGEAEDGKRALEAAEAAISNPLLDDVSMKGAKRVLINISGGPDMTLFEVDEAANRVRDEVDAEAIIIFGATLDDSIEGRMRVSVVATGIDSEALAGQRPALGQPPEPYRRKLHGGAPVALAAVQGQPVAVPAAALAEPEAVPEHVPARPPVTVAAVGAAAAVATVLDADARELGAHVPPGPLARTEPPAQPAASAMAPRPAERPATSASGDRERPFVAPRPMEPSSRRAPEGQPEPFAEAEVTNGGRKPGKGRRGGLLQRIARARARPAEGGEKAAPVPESETAVEPAEEEPATGGTEKDLIERQPEEDLLDIPAFLRRQAD